MYNVTRNGNCFIDDEGRVVFIRENYGNKKRSVSEDINSALSQNQHILEGRFKEFITIYNDNWVKKGEFYKTQKILEILQKQIKKMSQSLDPKEVDLSKLVEDLKNSRNKHKKNIFMLLNQGPKGMKSLSRAQMEAVYRINQLQGIIKGTSVQVKKLLKIKRKNEKMIIFAHDSLAKAEIDLRNTVNSSVFEKEKAIRKVVRDINSRGANKVLIPLSLVVKVNPFKERVESKEIKKLEELDLFYEEWKRNNDNFEKIIAVIAEARGKIKRIVRENNDFEEIKKY